MLIIIIIIIINGLIIIINVSTTPSPFLAAGAGLHYLVKLII